MSGEFRLEKDSLGEISVPAGAYYGAQTQRAVINFPISGKKPYRAFVWSIGLIKRAAAEVNSDLRLFDANIASAIIQAAAEVMQGRWDAEFVVDPFQAGAGTSHNMNANEVIANRATQLMGGKLGEYRVSPNDHVNMSQSTNDSIPTAIRLGCLWRLQELLAILNELSSTLHRKAAEFDGVLKSGRTHLQDAVPVRLGQEFSGYARAVERDTLRIQHAAEGLRRLGIGGTATGTGLNAHPEYHIRMVEKLETIAGFKVYTSDNLFESMQSMADAADFSASLRTLALTLTRIANDFRLLSSGPATGFDEIHLPAVQPGSSIMPGKVNPVLAEMLNMAMYHVIGLDTAVALASQAGQLELNVMMPVIANDLFEMMHITIGAVKAFTEKCVIGVQANPEKATGWLARNPIVVTALNPIIGYAKGAELVKEALQRDITVQEVAAEKARDGELISKETGEKITPAEIEAVFSSLDRFTQGGIIAGSGGGG